MSLRPVLVLRATVALLLTLVVADASAAALDIQLDFASLPSAQGFTYAAVGAHAGVLESSVFAVSGGTLYQDTMGLSNGVSGGSILYAMAGGVTAGDTKRILARARCLEAQVSATATLGQGGFIYGFNTGSVQYAFGLTPTRITILGPGGTSVLAGTYDNTQFHDYQFDFNPPSSYQLYRDGSLVASGSGGFAFAGSRWFFGDGTGGANARGETSALRFIQDVATPAGPATWGRLKADYR